MPTTSTALITPADLGLPPKFHSWRPGQWEAIERGASSDKRFIVHNMATGGGKSLVGVAHSILTGGRAVYITSTKGLQDQCSTDFSPCGMVDLRGRQNYHPCTKAATCADGKLLKCKGSDDGDIICPYLDARETFLKSNLTVTNYSCYFANIIYGEGMGNIDVLILDEAHAAIEELSSALEIRLNHAANMSLYKSLSITPPYQSPLPKWKSWASSTVDKIKAEIQSRGSGGDLKQLRLLDALAKNLSRIATIEDTWIVDESSTPAEVLFSPVWPTDYAEKLLFRGIKHVLLLSATIVPKTCELLNIPEADCLFISHSSTFPVSRCPVYLFGATNIDSKSSFNDLKLMVDRMDSLISRRLDRKGIIHPVSYDKVASQQFIYQYSDYRDIMLTPRGQGLNNALTEFRESEPPIILNTPAIKTGYDFPLSQCEYQFIVKLPFVDMRSPVMVARAEADPEYGAYLTAQTLVQTCGRAMRSEKDQVENFILDKHANWFMAAPKWLVGRNGKRRNAGGFRHLFPDWFIKQLVWPQGQPVPPPKLSLQ